MSAIVAIKANGRVYVGTDSQTSKGGSKLSLTNLNNFKIWKVKGTKHCVMGSVGVLRDSCAIRVMDNLIRDIDELHGDIDYEYVVNRVEPLIKDELKEREFIKADSPYDSMESRFLLATKDKIFTIEYGAVIEHNDYAVIGSGESEVIGSLESTETLSDPEERIVRAIKACISHNLYVSYPIILMNTKNDMYKVITEKNEDAILNKSKKSDTKNV
ncbi:MAG: hypothetical protein K5765_01175 [Clostridia bacterium]|nr:hypothetical protein [Clostridia bacterium]